MKMINTAPISGMQELLPKEQRIFDNLKQKLINIYKKHGFWQIETPIIERKEILLAKAGGETEKQIYFVSKTGQIQGEKDLEFSEALRFDHTVPLARYVSHYNNDLAFPAKLSQIGRNFRGERAQSGRFREFYQCDIDVLGRGDLAIEYDAEVILTLIEGLEIFGLENLVVRVNNRKIIAGFMETLNLSEKTNEILSVVDKMEKLEENKVDELLNSIVGDAQKVIKIKEFTKIRGDKKTVVNMINALVGENKNPLIDEGIREIDRVLSLVEENEKVKVIGDMMIVRGLDYYTGTVFEVFVDSDRTLGSLCGGGRYENLAGQFSKQNFPGVGGSIGLTRLFSVLKNKGLINDTINEPERLAIVPISTDEVNFAFEVAKKKREEGYLVDVVMIDKKLGDKINYASKIASKMIVIGEEEVGGKELVIKDLNSRI